MQATYGPGALGPIHGQANGTAYQVSFNGKFVTKIEVGMNYLSLSTGLICYLAFHTSTSTLGPFAIPGCTSSNTMLTGSGLAFIAGKSGFYLDMVNFYFYGMHH